MSDRVNDWQQAGCIYVWRYNRPSSRQRGWHFSGDPAGCTSLVDLVDRMMAACVTSHRTVRLGAVTPDVWGVPNYGSAKADRFEKLRLQFQPDERDLYLAEREGKLVLTFGLDRGPYLRAAFADVGIGEGDFGIATSNNKRAEHWMFWWMPRINYRHGKTL